MKLNPLNLKSDIIFLAVANLLLGCSGYQYVASPRFVPLNEKKGQLTANLYLSGVQAGYAFTDKFSVFATGYKRFQTIEGGNPISTERNQRSGESREINIGLSYFKKKNNLRYEVLAGAGMGDMTFANDFANDKNRDVGYTFAMEAKRRNVFIQPNFTYKINKANIDRYFAFAFFTKLNLVQYYNITTEGSFEYAAIPDSGINYFRTRTETNLFFIEPGVCVKAGSKNFKGTGQFSPIINLSGRALHYNMFSMNIGVAISLNLLKENK